jgi:riboflavin kinase / FMN adenylyltransferase
MKIIRGMKNILDSIPCPVVAIGNFDGVHVGHQIIFRKTAQLAKENGGTAIAFTFEPHPLKVLAPDKVPPLLTTFRKKMELIGECGIELVICADFTRQFSDQRPREFAHDILVKKIKAREIVVGFDYAFGRGREGTVRYLKQMGGEYGFLTHIIDPVKLNGYLVSSSYVRELIEDGKVEVAAKFLGRHYSITSPVIEGYKTGQKIGFPTANVDTSRIQIPGVGVYAVSIKHQNLKYHGVVNVGFNPTFNRDTLSVEAHIFNFNEKIYGQEIEVIFISRIRSEIKFKSADQLVEQIKKDIQVAKIILADLP